MISKKFLVTCVALTLPLAVAAAPFSNGDFESPGLAPGNFTSISDGSNSPPAGWAVGGTTTSFAAFYENGAFGVIGNSGPNAVGFGGNGTTGATLRQTFDTAPGTTYTVNYFVTTQQGIATGSQSVLVQGLNGASILGSSTSVIPDYNPNVEAYHWFAGTSLTFVATGASSTILFTDTSLVPDSNGTNWALDGVSISGGVAPPIPEPSTYALMVAGLGIMGFSARRKSKP